MSRYLGREKNKSQSRQEKRLAAYILKTKEEMLKNYFSQRPSMGEKLTKDIDNMFKEHLEEKYGVENIQDNKE